MTRERRLGRGLEALLGRPVGQPTIYDGPGDDATSAAEGLLALSVYEIDSNPFQPRSEFDQAEIESLAESIREHGIIQPLVVRREGDRYQLISGERRLRAAIKAGWSEVPVHVREADERQMAELAIVENLQRKDLNPLEKGRSFQQYLERYGCTQEELAGRLKIDRSTVANLIRLLELPDEVQNALRRGAITQGHARALLPLGEQHEQIAFAERIQAEGLSVRATESLVQETIQRADAEPLRLVTDAGATAPSKPPRSEHVAALEQQFRNALGTKVDIRQGAKGRGRITIHFTSHAEFERLEQLLCGMQQLAEQRHAG